jgi:hypothetical protein
MSTRKKRAYSQRVASIAGQEISNKGYVSPIDLFIGIGWLTKEKLTDWRMGKIAYLERVVTANLSKLTKTMKEFRAWAKHANLKPSKTVYKHKNCSLRFSKSGNPNIEEAYSTHYVLQSSNSKEDEKPISSFVSPKNLTITQSNEPVQ